MSDRIDSTVAGSDMPYWIISSGIGEDGGFGDYANPGLLRPVRDEDGKTYWFTSREDAERVAGVLSRSASDAFRTDAYSGDCPVEYRAVMVHPRRDAPVTGDGIDGLAAEIADMNAASWSVPRHEDKYTMRVRETLEEAVKNAPNYQDVLREFTRSIHEEYDDDLEEDGIVFNDGMITNSVYGERGYDDHPIDVLVDDELGGRGAHLTLEFRPFNYDDVNKDHEDYPVCTTLARSEWAIIGGLLRRSSYSGGEDYYEDYDEFVNDLPGNDPDSRIRRALGLAEDSDEWSNVVEFSGSVRVDGRDIGEMLYSPDLSLVCFASNLKRSLDLDSIGVITWSSITEIEDKVVDALNDKINKIPDLSDKIGDRVVTFDVIPPDAAPSEDEPVESMAAWEKELAGDGGSESRVREGLVLHEDRKRDGWIIREVEHASRS